MKKEPHMKAMVYQEYGPPEVLQLKEVEKPTPKEDEVLIEVQASSVTPLDWHFLTGTPYIARLMAGLLKPKRQVLGTDVAGTVDAIGANFEQFQPGNEVFGLSFNNGVFAEYLCVPEDQMTMVPKPAGLSFEEAAAVPYVGFTALLCLRDLGQIHAGQKVLINGASGGVGTLAVQMAKSFGTEVTGVCSTRNLEMVRSIGADRVIDYTQEDFIHGEEQYDLIFDAVRKRSFSECSRALSPRGIYVTTALSPTLMIQKQWVSMTRDKRLEPMPIARPDEEVLLDLAELLETGKITPVIDRRYLLSEVPEAIAYLGKGHARGKVMITFSAN
jgi:NADPH:quinone reductase-like Zn-dependent oxidoreductase